MKKKDFVIGQSFWLTGAEYRCTDIGTRIISAIKLGTIDIEKLKINQDGTKEVMCSQTSDTSWFTGPPYIVSEQVLDEYDQQACYPTWEKWKEAYPDDLVNKNGQSNQVICINNDGYEASLEVNKRYLSINDESANKMGLMRIIDESGESYLYFAKMFKPA